MYYNCKGKEPSVVAGLSFCEKTACIKHSWSSGRSEEKHQYCKAFRYGVSDEASKEHRNDPIYSWSWKPYVLFHKKKKKKTVGFSTFSKKSFEFRVLLKKSLEIFVCLNPCQNGIRPCKHVYFIYKKVLFNRSPIFRLHL